MKVSLNTIRFMNRRYKCGDSLEKVKYDKLIEKIGAQLGGVDEVVDLGGKYAGILVVKVVSCVPHPNADRLKICKIDDGGKAKRVKRDKAGLVQVVCGAPNVKEGLLVVWLPPGTTVPATADDDPFVLEARELRGEMSNGMLASPKELALGDSHEGLLIVDKAVAPGTPFADAYELKGDVVVDIENKMFTHRPDCFGFLGIARELAGIQQKAFKSPAWYRPRPAFPAASGPELKLEIKNEVPDLVPRFTAIVLRDVKIGPSPVWLQIELAKVGLRSVNNIVDYTNFFMLETGQPLHAYDYDKVKAQDAGADHATLTARNPRPDEKLVLLNGKTIKPRPEAIMIATASQAIALGGVMGGAETEVDQTTTNIIIECATFDMYSIRRTSMAHGLFTDGVTRFTKGQSPLQNLAVLAKITDEICRFANGKVAGPVQDDNHVPAATLGRGSLHPAVTISASFVNARLGFALSANDMATLLQNVEFSVAVHDDELTVTAPFWRTDIELREDVVEEIGRLYGYDKLPLELPKRDITPATKDGLLELKSRIRDVLSRAGANEVLTYSFVHGKLLENVTQNKEQAFKVSNALSPDLQYYRLHPLPSLLDKVHLNIKAGYDEFALFELGKGHNLMHADDGDGGVPGEIEFLDFVYTSRSKQAGAPFYQARHHLDALAQGFGLTFTYAPVPEDPHVPVADPYDYRRSAYVSVAGSDVFLGMVGELKPSVIRSLKLPSCTAAFTIGPSQLFDALAKTPRRYRPLSKFPKVSQDITLKVPAAVTYQALHDGLLAALGKLQPAHTQLALTALDIYQKTVKEPTKQMTFRVTITSTEKTLTDGEVNGLLDRAAKQLSDKLGAARI